MALETGTYISDLVATNPTGADAKSTMDNHLRLIKSTVKVTFPNLTGAMTATHGELNHMVGATTQPAMKDGSNLVTPAVGDSSTKIATTSFVAAVAFSSALPAISVPVADYLTTNNGVSGSWSNKLKSGTIRWADSTDTTKLVAFNVSGLTTATTRTVTFGDRDVDLGLGYLKVSDQKASGTGGGDSLAADITQTRVLNTVEVNTIAGASLAANIITLPAGTYRYRVRAPQYNMSGGGTGGVGKAFLYNATDAAYTGIGSNTAGVAGATVGSVDTWVSGQFTIAASKTFTVRHWTYSAVTGSLGVAVGSGQVEVYTEAEFWKVG